MAPRAARLRLLRPGMVGSSRDVGAGGVVAAAAAAVVESPRPPVLEVRIDNQKDPFATIVSVDYGNKLGDLLDTITALKALNLNIKRAKISGGTSSVHKFYITDASECVCRGRGGRAGFRVRCCVFVDEEGRQWETSERGLMCRPAVQTSLRLPPHLCIHLRIARWSMLVRTSTSPVFAHAVAEKIVKSDLLEEIRLTILNSIQTAHPDATEQLAWGAAGAHMGAATPGDATAPLGIRKCVLGPC